MAAIKAATQMPDEKLVFEIESWVAILYELAATFHRWPAHRDKLLELATPLYNGRVASFINRTRDMTSQEAEAVVEEQAQAFEDHRRILDELWEASGDLDAELDQRLNQV
jgi:hypothetical protein